MSEPRRIPVQHRIDVAEPSPDRTDPEVRLALRATTIRPIPLRDEQGRQVHVLPPATPVSVVGRGDEEPRSLAFGHPPLIRDLILWDGETWEVDDSALDFEAGSR